MGLSLSSLNTKCPKFDQKPDSILLTLDLFAYISRQTKHLEEAFYRTAFVM